MLKKDPVTTPEHGAVVTASEGRLMTGPLAHDHYRCPVSTPADTRRQSMKPHTYVTFTNLNRSVNIPPNSVTNKNFNYSLLHKRRHNTRIRKKNFDCYFVQDSGGDATVDGQAKPTWLSSLCSQPVDEIFYKYQRQAESSMRSTGFGRARNVSTAGEKALVTAWSCNASQRAPSSMSRSTQSAGPTAETPTSRVSNNEILYPSLRVYGYDQDPDKQVVTPRFGLGPVSPVPDMEVMNTNYNAGTNTPTTTPTQHRAAPLFPTEAWRPVVDPDVYTQYERDRRLPHVHVQPRHTSKAATSPRLKRYNSEHIQQTAATTQKENINLDKSIIQIIPFEHLVGHNRMELGKKYNCRYLSKTDALLPLPVQGKG